MSATTMTGRRWLRAPSWLSDGQIDPRGSLGFSLLVLATVLVVLAAAFTLSFEGLLVTARWAGYTGGREYLVPIAVDGSIFVFSLTAIWERARGMATLVSWAYVVTLTTVSAFLNWSHVATTNVDDQRIIGGALAMLLPLLVLGATHKVFVLMVRHDDLKGESAKAATDEIAAQRRASRSREMADAERANQLVAQRERWRELGKSRPHNPNSPEREEEKAIIWDTYIRLERSVPMTMKELGLKRNQVLQVVGGRDALPFPDTSR